MEKGLGRWDSAGSLDAPTPSSAPSAAGTERAGTQKPAPTHTAGEVASQAQLPTAFVLRPPAVSTPAGRHPETVRQGQAARSVVRSAREARHEVDYAVWYEEEERQRRAQRGLAATQGHLVFAGLCAPVVIPWWG